MKTLLTLILFTTTIFSSGFNLTYYTKFLPKNPVIIDCGAHTGYSSIALKRKWPMSSIHCIEADPFVYKILQRKIRNTRGFTTYNIALHSEDGEVSFYSSEKIKGLSQRHPGQFA